jgi:flagellar biosynthesis/type III secretory pathway chaperone
MPIQALVQALQEQRSIQNELLEIAQQKKGAIVRNDLELLNRLVNREAKLIRNSGEAEHKRQHEMSRYIVGKGYRPDASITMSDMVKIVFNAEEKTALQNLQAELLDLTGRLKEANDLNQQLIEQSLQFINFTLDILTGSPEDDAVYHHPDQQYTAHKRAGLFDTKA